MDWNIFLPIITALSGIFAGWCLKELSSFLEMRREDKIKFREILANLLEVWSIISRSRKAGIYIERYIHNITDLFPEISLEDKSALQEAINWFMNAYVTPFIDNLIKENIQTLNTTYEKAVVDLLTVDPILAFKLRGKVISYNQGFEYLNLYITNIKGFIGSDVQELKKIEKSNEALNKMLKEVFLEDLTNDLFETAKKIGRKTEGKVKLLIKDTIDIQTEDIDAELTAFINKMRESGVIPVPEKSD